MTDLGWIEGAANAYEAGLERDADCHYGDHDILGNGYCDNCGYFSGGLLQWKAVEKAEREGRHHGNHYHLTDAAAQRCKHPTHDEGPCGDQGGCMHHEPSAAFDHALLVEQGLVPA
jgi:hypothetical protein